MSSGVALTFVARPEVGVWRDMNDKFGLHFSAGYMVARPTVGIKTSLGEERRPIRADMLQLRVGLAYAVF